MCNVKFAINVIHNFYLTATETEEGFIKINTRKISEEARPSSAPVEDTRAASSLSDSYHNTCRKVPLTDAEPEEAEMAMSQPIAEGKPCIRSLRHLLKVGVAEREKYQRYYASGVWGIC